MTTFDLELLTHTLDERIPEQAWKPVLRVLQITGLADTNQLRQGSGFSRDRVVRLMEQLQHLPPQLPAVVRPLGRSVPRPGKRGRAPTIYCLEKGGAALLRQMGYAGTKACGLREDTPIQHALAMVDFHLLAEQAQLQVVTDGVLSFQGGQVRPDHQVTLPDGTQALFEIEQRAYPASLRRILNSLRHKQALFQSPQGQRWSPVIRMLIHLPRKQSYQRTLRIWQQAWDLLAQDQGGNLPFTLLAMPLAEFQQDPDWQEPPLRERWDGLQEVSSVAAPPAKVTTPVKRSQRAPQALLRRTPEEDHLLLQALWLWFREEERWHIERYARPTSVFFDTMDVIYTASGFEDGLLLQEAGIPWGAIYLLRQYLRGHPVLHQQLRRAIRRGNRNMRWNVSTILHHMQVVVNTFLAYHGYRPDGPLQVYTCLASWDSPQPRTFDVAVKIHSWLLLSSPVGDDTPLKDRIQRAEEALRWVLLSLFQYAHFLDLPLPGYW
ncbi:MAG: hypothetical protein D6791_00380 [Chloroflexi bacterium]|nr:MAG: hypothetical protein D6791_00380 [Chloroflexota bacterium]